MIARLLSSTIFLALPGTAYAEPVVFDRDGVAFFVLTLAVTGSIAWWRHTRGDKLVAVAVWSAALVTALMCTRYGPSDTLRFLASVMGA